MTRAILVSTLVFLTYFACAFAAQQHLSATSSDPPTPDASGSPPCNDHSPDWPQCAFSDPDFRAGARPGGIDSKGYVKPNLD